MSARQPPEKAPSPPGQELAAEAEALSWGVSFRVDDDRLSPSGSDVYVGQTATGKGSLSTGIEYWLEKKVNGHWEKLPTIADAPAVTSDGISLAKGGTATGKGSLSTGIEYWLEKKVNGHWEKLPTIADAPAVTSDGISLAKGGPSTYGYLDWTPPLWSAGTW